MTLRNFVMALVCGLGIGGTVLVVGVTARIGMTMVSKIANRKSQMG